MRMRLEPIEREISLLVPEAYSDAEKSNALAEFAQRNIEEVDTANYRIVGHRIPYDVWVDGREGAALSSVRPHGRIEAEWTFYEELLYWIDAQLIAHSPVGTPPEDPHPGLYMQSHELTADGRLVDRSQPMPMAEEYAFVNTQPYARKIERGHSSQAPNGVYETVAHLAARRFGNMARIRFGYRSPLFGSVKDWAGRTRLQPKGRRRTGSSRQDWLTRQPAIIVTPR